MKTLSASATDSALFTLLFETSTRTESARISTDEAWTEAEKTAGKYGPIFRTVKDSVLAETEEDEITPEIFFTAYELSPFSDTPFGGFVRATGPDGRTFLFLVTETNSLALSVEVISGPEEDETVEIISPAYRKENPDGGEGYFFFRTAFSASGTSRPDPRFYAVAVPLFY